MLIFLNGSINSGKSTLAKALAEEFGKEGLSLHIEGDLVVDQADLEFHDWIVASVARAAELGCRESLKGKWVFISYPLREEDWQVVLKISEKFGIKPLCITLAPELSVASGDRIDRKLDTWERNRVLQMYTEGYQERIFSNLTIDNSHQTPQQTMTVIKDYLVELKSGALS